MLSEEIKSKDWLKALSLDIIVSNNNRVNNWCFCKWEDFFEENGIIINVQYRATKNKTIGKWQYKINYNQDQENYISDGYKTKQEVKTQACLKAAEILEESL